MAAHDLVSLLDDFRRSPDTDTTPLTSLSARGYVSRSHLSRTVKKELGFPLRDFVAALRIERSIRALVRGRDLGWAQAEAGHDSRSSFHRSFQRHTGMAPAAYVARARLLADLVRTVSTTGDILTLVHRNFLPGQHRQEHAVTLRVEGAEPDSVLFLALNPTHIIRGNPTFGVALRGTAEYVVDDIPDGTYYAMVVEVPPGAEWHRFFVFDENRRQLDRDPVTFPLDGPASRTLRLRELEPTDPPIAANLPKLVFDAMRGRVVEESNSGHPGTSLRP